MAGTVRSARHHQAMDTTRRLDKLSRSPPWPRAGPGVHRAGPSVSPAAARRMIDNQAPVSKRPWSGIASRFVRRAVPGRPYQNRRGRAVLDGQVLRHPTRHRRGPRPLGPHPAPRGADGHRLAHPHPRRSLRPPGQSRSRRRGHDAQVVSRFPADDEGGCSSRISGVKASRRARVTDRGRPSRSAARRRTRTCAWVLGRNEGSREQPQPGR